MRGEFAVSEGSLSDAKLRDEFVIVAAHFDHLGVRGGKLYPGADDNASGVAMLLEVAEYFALRKEKPRRTIAFVAFDQEEAGLLGSMGTVGDCYDNSMMESFWGTMQLELLDRRTWKSRKELANAM